MKKLIVLYIIISIIGGCSFGNKMIQEDVLYKSKEYVGKFDTCWYHPGKFMVAPSVLIRTDETTFLCIYGKKCDFVKGEWLYVRHEYWNVAMKWKPTITNYDETKKYYLK